MKNIGELFDLGHNHGKRILPRDGIMMCNQSSGRDRRALVIAIGKDLMESCRWVTGDRCTIDLDPVKSEMTLRRVDTTDKQVVSWMMSSRSGEKGAKKGRTEPVTVKITATPIMLSAFGMDDADTPYIPSPVITGPAGITFPLKKAWMVVNRPKQQRA